jgi:hypothetical protein
MIKNCMVRLKLRALLSGLECAGLVALLTMWTSVVFADEFALDLATLEQLSPAVGTVIDSSNVGEHIDLLDPDLAALIGQDWLSITVGEISDFRPHENFVTATAEFGSGTALGSNPGELFEYVAGRPFPGVPNLDDARAGEKLAWNMRYVYGGDSGQIPEMYWYYIDMHSQSVERVLEFEASQMRFKHRHVLSPTPELKRNTHDVFSAITLEALEPGDVAKTKLLIFYNSDDTQAEQGWMYVPLLRRVRRIATTARTDSFLGSDIMIEDFLGYSGRIMDMDWKFVGETHKLLPMYSHDKVPLSDKKARKGNYNFVDFHGHSGCFPNVTWQPRKVYILEGRPKRADHPIGTRFFYIDAQTMSPVFGKIYDRADVLWKYVMVGLAHPDEHLPENAGTGVPMIDTASVVDVQNMHCTALQMVTKANIEKVKRKEFEPSSLNTGAR